MGFSFRRAFTPPARIIPFIPARVFKITPDSFKPKTLLSNPIFNPVGAAVQKTTGVSAFKQLLIGAGVGLGALVGAAGAGGAGKLAGTGATGAKVGGWAKIAGFGALLKNQLGGIFKGKGDQLEEQAQAVDYATTGAEPVERQDSSASARPPWLIPLVVAGVSIVIAYLVFRRR